MINEKEQIYSWFKTLDGSKRIQFLHGILHLCFPLELRYMGTCIEELARKDYNYLRDAETKANVLNEVHSIKDISDRVQRSKLIVTLALLNSTNQECAREVYKRIERDILTMKTKEISDIYDKFADEYLLILAMAANHPAFEFWMKTVISNHLKLFETQLSNDRIEPQEMIINQAATSSSNNNNNIKNEIENDYSSSGDITITSTPLTIKSINFESAHLVEGTNSYKFAIKVIN